MTLPLNSRLSALYDTNGTQKDFSFGFRVFFDPDNGGYGLEVRRQTADGYEVIPKSDYLVLPVEDNSAGVVRFSVAPSAGQQIYIAGKTPTIQQLVLTNFGRYSAESIETQFDFITAIIQEWLSALGEETRQRIANDEIVKEYADGKFLEFQSWVYSQFPEYAESAFDGIFQGFYSEWVNALDELNKDNLKAQNLFDGDKNQKEINSDFKSLTKTSAERFTNFLTAIDSAPVIASYANSLNDGDTLLIPSGKWAIKSPCIITKNINIRSDGELVVSGDTNAYLKFNQPYEVELSGDLHLSQLPKTGDTKLYLNAAGLALLSANPAEYSFALNSSEVEIVRIGYADPYYKNETLAFLDSSLTVRGQIDLTYTDAAKLKIKMYRKQKSTRVQLNLSMQPNAGQTTGARILEAEGVNSILWDVTIDRSNSANIAGTSFKYKNCTSFAFLPSCQIRGGQSDASDSYAYLNEASSYIVYQGGADYYDIGTTTKKERGYAARHGKYVYFNAVNFNGIDDHYGHHYYVANMALNNRGIGIAGGSVTLENVRQLGDAFLMANRLDTPYNDGQLRMINCHAKAGLLIAECTNNASYNSKYKTWDDIEIIDCSTDSSENWQHGIRFNNFYAHNVNTKTKKLTIRNFGFNRLAGAAKWLQSASEHFIDVEIDNIKLSSAGASATAAMSTGITASGHVELNRVSGLDGNWISATMDIDKTKLGFSSASSLLLLSSGEMNIGKSNLSDDLTGFSSASNQGSVTLLGNKINSAKYFSNANFRNAIAAGFANQVNVAINFDGDLRNYQKTKPFRYASVNFALGTLAVGAASAVQTETVAGARFGDKIDAVFTTNSNGLRANAWVSANDTVQYYVENPAGNPNGSQTFANIVLRLTARSN